MYDDVMVQLLYKASVLRLGLVLRPVDISDSVVCSQAQADHSTGNPTTINKPPPTVLDILQIDSLDHEAKGDHSSSTASNKERRSSTGCKPGRGEERDLRGRQSCKHLLSFSIMFQRNALDSCLDIILDIHMSVNHVVQDRPCNVRSIEAGCGGQSWSM
ncbi:hypothetical protein KAF25_000609 [Fusarium avenaceum]|uniref:Uncharacterized protein n=1 Tax=Fusarium avenaceum TaxID=40199 RepID=A0A9P7H6M6_9HYPO|nr:hypothetical protein KAF25_000609 [Fusarium avenaceum]